MTEFTRRAVADATVLWASQAVAEPLRSEVEAAVTTNPAMLAAGAQARRLQGWHTK